MEENCRRGRRQDAMHQPSETGSIENHQALRTPSSQHVDKPLAILCVKSPTHPMRQDISSSSGAASFAGRERRGEWPRAARVGNKPRKGSGRRKRHEAWSQELVTRRRTRKTRGENRCRADGKSNREKEGDGDGEEEEGKRNKRPKMVVNKLSTDKA